MKPWGHRWAGALHEATIESDALRDNPLGDPHVRPIWVYTPPGYEADAERRFPSVYLIQGLTGQLDMWRNRSAFRPTVPELFDELFAGGCPPVLVVFVDAWTRLGGSQFLDSPGTGRYHTYLVEEVVDWVDSRYRTVPAAGQRGIMGKSSGGYGAMVTAMLRPDRFGALATHAGDALFEVCYLHDFGAVVRALRDDHGGSFERFWEDFRSRPAFSRSSDADLLNAWCMAACYSADPDGTVRLPFDPATGRLDDAVWRRWLERDPVRMASRHADALRSMRAIWIDAGRGDEYFLDLGAEAFRRELEAIGVTEQVCFELFDGKHGGIEYRYPMALKYLAERLSSVNGG
jgi:pimeloyl-ACP methyl ester carboxylesterase